MIAKLNSLEFFKGLTKWSELEPVHFRVLISNVVMCRDRLPIAEQFNEKNVEVTNMYFLITALVYHIMLKTTAAVDVIRINRITEAHLTYEMTLAMIPDGKTEKPKTGLQVVVDNTTK